MNIVAALHQKLLIYRTLDSNKLTHLTLNENAPNPTNVRKRMYIPINYNLSKSYGWIQCLEIHME